MAPPLVASAAPVLDGRRAVVERVLRTADDLERRARTSLAAGATRLALATAAGVVAAGSRQRLVLGRAPGCEVVLTGQHVSRRHAALVRRQDGWWVEDLGSRNGTFCG
ncbi:MAG TPA: FHA domain-containing protein, partial [Anaeromyxobacteraceae bacterium]|nr:FHA domain-containing protein [Anaeromyxobacteraceae bacterium]